MVIVEKIVKHTSRQQRSSGGAERSTSRKGSHTLFIKRS
jgi:hypothetical protein